MKKLKFNFSQTLKRNDRYIRLSTVDPAVIDHTTLKVKNCRLSQLYLVGKAYQENRNFVYTIRLLAFKVRACCSLGEVFILPTDGHRDRSSTNDYSVY